MKNRVLYQTVRFALLALLWLGQVECSRMPPTASVPSDTALVLDWNDLLLSFDRYTEGYVGPVAARAFAYIGVAAYEVAQPAAGGQYRSLAGQWEGLTLPPSPTGQDLYLPAALNACYAAMFHHFFATAPLDMHRKRRRLFEQWEKRLHNEVPPVRYELAVAYGRAVADAVFAWSATDTVGHDAFLHLYDTGYSLSPKEGAWQPSAQFTYPPLLPKWQYCRTFIASPADYMAAPLPAHSSAPGTHLYNQALEVYTLSRPASPENRWIAEFWSDDHNGLTYSPAGRWIAIANQVVAKERPDIHKTVDTYLHVGVALHDAFVACWASKYHYNLERPETFIQRVFDPRWLPLGPSPPFPAYPSGHSLTSAAAASVLAALYGDDYAMTDRSHEGRTEFNGMPRYFASFQDMARESALSRLYLGVHYRMDCDEGLHLGTSLGRAVATGLSLPSGRLTSAVE